MKRLLIVMAMLMATTGLKAQKWGETPADSIKCWENYNNFGSLYNSKSYADAYEYWYQVYANCPGASSYIYIAGPKIVESKIEIEKDPAKKEKLIDLLLEQYDKRLEYFPDPNKEAYVLGQKALDMVKYREDSIEKAYYIYRKAIKLDPSNLGPAVINGFFLSAVKMFNDKKIDTEEFFEVYNQASEAIEVNNNQLNREIAELQAKKDSGQISAKEERTLDRSERILDGYNRLNGNIEKMVSPLLTCDGLARIYSEEAFEKNKTNATWLKRALKMLTKQRQNEEGEMEDCTSNPIFYKAAEALFALEPSATAARSMGNIAIIKKEYKKAIDFYSQAADEELDPLVKAEDLLKVGSAYLAQGNAAQAKNYALKAAKLKGGWGDPYLLIAQAYATAEGDCGSNVVENKAVFLAAMDKARYAASIDPSVSKRANKLINYYEGRLPEISVAFQLNYKEGDKYTIGCWINETVTLRFKK
ncbi:MAG: hypothetical protein LPK46_08880 [Bacteroidota bacterium]|nr:hypothetical protein [Bacteroidota bacterium]MDX5506237.1 hypothetical protein [Bacteroidota bacterium]